MPPINQRREEIASLARNLLTKSYEPSLLEQYIAARLIPLNKNPGIRPISIGESLRRLIGKTITKYFNSEIKEAAGPLQTCAGHGAGAEAAIHGMKDIFSSEETDGVLLIDASNAFNRLNRTAALHNIVIMPCNCKIRHKHISATCKTVYSWWKDYSI